MMKWFLVGIATAILLALLPLTAAAATNPEIIAILNASIDGLVKLTKLAYCAAGFTPAC